MSGEIVGRLERLAASEGLELVEVAVAGTARRPVVRLTLDRDAGGVSLADCETVSRQASVLLDAHDPFPDAFTLEVSSPGLDRKLTRDKDFARSAGQPVKVRMRPSWPAPRTFDATLEGHDGAAVHVRDLAGEARVLPLAEVFEIRLDPFRGESSSTGAPQRAKKQGRTSTR